MFGLFTDNKPDIIKAIGFASAAEVEHFELVKQEVLKIVHDNKNARLGVISRTTMLIDSKIYELPRNFGIRVKGSSREMFQALNQISKNAEYSVESDYASGDVANFEISMMKVKGTNEINIMADVKNKVNILYGLIKENGGQTL